jgi:hypothetical protein
VALSTDITIEERDALREQALNHLYAVDDLRQALEDEDFETAERLGCEFADELRLMEDLGWGDAPTAGTIQLTMAPEELHRLFTHMRADAEAQQLDEAREQAEAEDEAREHHNRAKRVTEVCERMLSIVARTPPPGLVD